MKLDIPRLKLRSQEIIRTSDPKAINVGLVFLLITVLFSILSAGVFGSNVTQHDMEQLMEHWMHGNADYAMEYLQRMIPSPSAYAVDAALEIVLSIVSAGFVIFLLNTIRNMKPCFENLLDGFGMIFRIILLNLLESLFIFLWSLLLIVPGIIAAYKYRQAIYLLLDHPEMTVMDCIRESKRMMNGHKWELFVLDISFLGWQLLSGLAVIGWAVQVWTVPYLNMTYALYYEMLCGKDIYGDGSGSYRGFSPEL